MEAFSVDLRERVMVALEEGVDTSKKLRASEQDSPDGYGTRKC